VAIRFGSGSAVVVAATGCVANSAGLKLGSVGLRCSGGSAAAEFYASGSKNNHVWTLVAPDGDFRSHQFLTGLAGSPSGWYVELTGTGSAMLEWAA